MKTPKTTGDASAGQLGVNEVLNGSNTLPAIIEISGGNNVQLGDVVQAAFTKSAISAEAWNALEEAERDRLLNEVIEDMKSAVAKDGVAVIPANTAAGVGAEVSQAGEPEKKPDIEGSMKTGGDEVRFIEKSRRIGLTVTCLILHNGARIEPGHYKSEALQALPFSPEDEEAFVDLVKIGAIVLDKEDDDAEAQS